MRPPIPIQTQQISPLILDACRTVVESPQPVFVPVRLETYSKDEDCHRNVAEKVRRDGGQAYFGWAVWEIPDWEIQLEFHSVWQSHQGFLADVSPPLHGGPQVLFLHDPVRVYEGCNISTLHYPYTTSEICREFVEVSDQINRLIFPPGKAGKRHFVPTEPMTVLQTRLRDVFRRAKQL
jgi:hypothetical protein